MLRRGSAARDGHAVKRMQGRLAVRLDARLKSHSQTHTAILENISKSGAKLAITGAPQVGSDVVVQWHTHDAFGTIAWATATHCGVLFASSVPQHILQATLSLDEVAHVPNEMNVDSAAAKAWFDGKGRFGFD